MARGAQSRPSPRTVLDERSRVVRAAGAAVEASPRAAGVGAVVRLVIPLVVSVDLEVEVFSPTVVVEQHLVDLVYQVKVTEAVVVVDYLAVVAVAQTVSVKMDMQEETT